MRLSALTLMYLRRLTVQGPQELLAGLGVFVSVALVFAVVVANGSIAGSASKVVRTVVGPASLQLRARGNDGFDESLLNQVKHLPGVRHAAPLLEQTATVDGPHGRRTVDLAGADNGLVFMDGLSRTLPLASSTGNGISLSRSVADEIGIHDANSNARVAVQLRGRTFELGVAAILGPDAAGALARAPVVLIQLKQLQQLTGLKGRVTRILVQTKPHLEAATSLKLRALSKGRLSVARADQDITLLRQALGPSNQATEIFAAISALLGLLLAFNALLLTVPERRQVVADLRQHNTRHSAIIQMMVFQALLLGTIASALGLLGGFALSRGVFHSSTGYLAQAFTLGSDTVVGWRPLVFSLFGGIFATCAASMLPLLDLRRGVSTDAVYSETEVPGNALGKKPQLLLVLAAAASLLFTVAVLLLKPSLVLVACAVLALATVLATPLSFSGIIRTGEIILEHTQKLGALVLAVTSLKVTTLRSLALAATGAVALFGSIALGGARADLLRGIHEFAHSYSADADIWVGNPGDNQAVVDFLPGQDAASIAQLPGVASVRAFQGGFVELGNRRAWIIARPPGSNQQVLKSQLNGGNLTSAMARLAEGGWVVISKQIADAAHIPIGGTLTIPTPSGNVRFRLAATTTNLAWSPGVIFMRTADYSRFWGTSTPTALGVKLELGASLAGVRHEIMRALGTSSGLEVSTSQMRETRIDALTSAGLGQLREISWLLIIAAVMAMTAALVSAIWQRRPDLAGLRLEGLRRSYLRRILLTESALMLSAGYITGALTGVYGQVIIDAYLKRSTGFPIAGITTSWRPLEILGGVAFATLVLAAVAGAAAARVPKSLALRG